MTGYEFAFRWGPRKEKFLFWLAKHVPKRLRQAIVVMAAVKACGDTKSPGDCTYREMYYSA